MTTPLQRYVRVQRLSDADLRRILADAAKEAERLIAATGPNAGLGGRVEQARLRVLLRGLRSQQIHLYTRVSSSLHVSFENAATAAAEAELDIDRILFRGANHSMDRWGRTVLRQVLDNVPTLEARAFNGIRLSEAVYRTQALSQGLVDKSINRGIVLGRSAKQIAAEVAGLINPNTPGGVSYAAMRLGRTELNNAFHQTQIDLRADNPWTEGMKWNLSGSHPHPDECNQYAEETHFRGGDPGVFRPGDVPGKPHPNCLCFLTTEVVGEDEFIGSLLNGEYEDFLSRGPLAQ